MTNARIVFVAMLLSAATLACGALGAADPDPTQAAAVTSSANTQPSATPATVDEATAPVAPTEAAPTDPPAPTATALPSVTPVLTAAPLKLEVVQSRAWTDPAGQVRVNVLLRNPYDYPVEPAFKSHVTLVDAAGALVRDRELYVLDGISGGSGFLLPGETLAANACFTCEALPIEQAWTDVTYQVNMQAATDAWHYSTAVTGTVTAVQIDPSSPLFSFDGTATNNSAGSLQRVSVRLFVYDAAGTLVAAAEGAGYDVEPGATLSMRGYGFAEPASGELTYVVTAVGVNYGP